MRRKPSSFDAFMEEVEAETRAAGLQAEAEARALRDHFRLAVQVLRRRRELGLTQKELAVAVGVHQSEISDIERGASAPGFRTLTRLATGLQADVALVPWPKKAVQVRSRHTKAGGARRAPRVAGMARTVAARKRAGR